MLLLIAIFDFHLHRQLNERINVIESLTIYYIFWTSILVEVLAIGTIILPQHAFHSQDIQYEKRLVKSVKKILNLSLSVSLSIITRKNRCLFLNNSLVRYKNVLIKHEGLLMLHKLVDSKSIVILSEFMIVIKNILVR